VNKPYIPTPKIFKINILAIALTPAKTIFAVV
jgi:hypothetical protein